MSKDFDYGPGDYVLGKIESTTTQEAEIARLRRKLDYEIETHNKTCDERDRLFEENGRLAYLSAQNEKLRAALVDIRWALVEACDAKRAIDMVNAALSKERK